MLILEAGIKEAGVTFKESNTLKGILETTSPLRVLPKIHFPSFSNYSFLQMAYFKFYLCCAISVLIINAVTSLNYQVRERKNFNGITIFYFYEYTHIVYSILSKVFSLITLCHKN